MRPNQRGRIYQDRTAPCMRTCSSRRDRIYRPSMHLSTWTVLHLVHCHSNQPDTASTLWHWQRCTGLQHTAVQGACLIATQLGTPIPPCTHLCTVTLSTLHCRTCQGYRVRCMWTQSSRQCRSSRRRTRQCTCLHPGQQSSRNTPRCTANTPWPPRQPTDPQGTLQQSEY